MMLWMLPSEFIDATKLYRIPAMNSSVSEIDKIVADYLIAVETGDNADLDTLCERHPEHADGIRDYFALRANVLQVFGNEDASAAIQIEGYDILREIGRGGDGGGVRSGSIETAPPGGNQGSKGRSIGIGGYQEAV